ncbi:MAG: ABC-F family ATP-binding cassette domain-containing protein [Eubacteriaceae bacterium]|nr:ABC-F family ATP-binding cassette domain-containing protein [Eubacteriaceae bacterium]
MLVSVSNLNKSFGIDDILRDVSFNIDEHSKVGIVGKNGTGKSTLFKILSGEMTYDSGNLVYGRNVTVGYLAQLSDLDPENTLYQEVLGVFKPLMDLENEIRSLEKQISASHKNDLTGMMNKYALLTERFDKLSGYEYESRTKGILNGLGFSREDLDTEIKAFSGGQKTRISLAKLLLKKPDLLLLDEPTNFLDIDTIQWLENYLKGYEGGYMIISHDRYFLDSLTETIFELENKKITIYNGNFTNYVNRKKENLEIMLHQFKIEQKEIKRQEEIIKKFREFNREKSIKRAESREKLLAKMPKTEMPFMDESSVSINFEPKVKSGKLVLEVKDLAKSYDKNLFSDVSFEIYRGDRVGFIGLNGSGKTTMLKIIEGLVSPDKGTVTFGHNVEPVFFRQDNASLNMESTVIDEVWDASPYVSETAIRNTLSYFKFYDEDVFKDISVLSGGEMSRVALARLMLKGSNFILMDEPTNHLDMSTVDVLEKALSDYSGTLFIISHDRYFLNKTVDILFVLNNGRLEIYNGNYDYYVKKTEEAEMLRKLGEQGPVMTKTETVNLKKVKNQQKKELTALKNQVKVYEESISETENSIQKLEMQICSEGFYDDYENSSKINMEYEGLKVKLSELMDLWTEKQIELEALINEN